MEELFAMLSAMESKMLAMELELVTLRKENEDLRARLNVVKPAAEPLKEYDRVEDIIWEKLPWNANSWMIHITVGGDPRGYKHVILKGVGEVYRMPAQKQTPDWYAIAHARVLDVTKNPWVHRVQEGDDSYESDPEDMKQLVREYSGGLRYNISNWDAHQLGAELKQVWLETHTETGPVDVSRPIDIAPPPR